MKFLSKEISDKLIKLGCKSTTGLYHYSYSRANFVSTNEKMEYNNVPLMGKVILSTADFIGDEKQCIENCKILWGEEQMTPVTSGVNVHGISGMPTNLYFVRQGWEYRRIEMMKAFDQADYIEKSAKEYKGNETS